MVELLAFGSVKIPEIISFKNPRKDGFDNK